MNDKQDLIHKAVGWMLREAGKKDEKQLLIFLDQHISKMHRTTLRYSIERFSPEKCQDYLSKN
ncbi:MAG: DNA alkylation repair protein [Rickettsia endosymbiont of Argas persicus]